jgi:hypothetical protein
LRAVCAAEAQIVKKAQAHFAKRAASPADIMALIRRFDLVVSRG